MENNNQKHESHLRRKDAQELEETPYAAARDYRQCEIVVKSTQI